MESPIVICNSMLLDAHPIPLDLTHHRGLQFAAWLAQGWAWRGSSRRVITDDGGKKFPAHRLRQTKPSSKPPAQHKHHTHRSHEDAHIGFPELSDKR